jgi:hypothetical protein
MIRRISGVDLARFFAESLARILLDPEAFAVGIFRDSRSRAALPERRTVRREIGVEKLRISACAAMKFCC